MSSYKLPYFGESPEAGEIYNKFIIPFLKFKPKEKSIEFFIAEDIFHFSERIIQKFVVRKDFKMPGLFYKSSALPIRYYGYRTIRKGDKLWIRHDVTRPEVYDVEVEFKEGDSRVLPIDAQVFQLNPYQLFVIKDFIRGTTSVDPGGPAGPIEHFNQGGWKKRKRRSRRK